MGAGGLAIIYLFPRLTRAVPSPLVAIIVLSALSIWLALPVNTVGDMGELPSSLPYFFVPDVPLTFETLRIVLPYSVTMADRKSVVWGKSVSVRVDHGGRRIFKKKKETKSSVAQKELKYTSTTSKT